MPDDINHLQGQVPRFDINFRIYDTFLTISECLTQRRTIRPKDHGKASTWCFCEWRMRQLGLFFVCLGQHLRGHEHETCSFHRHELAGAALGIGSHVVGKWHTFRFVPERWPASDVNINALRILVITQKRLEMLPAIEAADSAKCRGCYTGEGLRLAITPD